MKPRLKVIKNPAYEVVDNFYQKPLINRKQGDLSTVYTAVLSKSQKKNDKQSTKPCYPHFYEKTKFKL